MQIKPSRFCHLNIVIIPEVYTKNRLTITNNNTEYKHLPKSWSVQLRNSNTDCQVSQRGMLYCTEKFYNALMERVEYVKNS